MANTITTTVKLFASISGLPGGGTRNISSDQEESTGEGIGTTQLVDLASGNNEIDIPTDATQILIAPPSDNTTVTLKLKGADDTDTGQTIAKTGITKLTRGADTSFHLNASAGLDGVEVTFL